MGKIDTFSKAGKVKIDPQAIHYDEMVAYVAFMLGPILQKGLKVDHMLRILLEWLTGDFEVVDSDGQVIGKVNFDIAGFSEYSLRRKAELEKEEADEESHIISTEGLSL